MGIAHDCLSHDETILGNGVVSGKRSVVVRPPAKINWTLEVLGKRPDGYHEIATVMSTISLCDELRLCAAGRWSFTVDAPGPLRSELEVNNLVREAVQLLHPSQHNAAGLPPLSIHLTKRIPAAAGLGGGSSDAAATLTAWRAVAPDLALPGPQAALLSDIAARLGSDVPFFLRGGTQLATGRGERLEPLPDPPAQWLVLLAPPLVIERKTATLYALLGSSRFGDGAATTDLVARLRAGGSTIDERSCVNVFEQVADVAFPGLDGYRRALEQAALAPAHLSGSGPALFALVDDEAAAVSAAAALTDQGLRAWAVHTLPAERAAAVTVE